MEECWLLLMAAGAARVLRLLLCGVHWGAGATWLELGAGLALWFHR
jgi:hypothetical protein